MSRLNKYFDKVMKDGDKYKVIVDKINLYKIASVYYSIPNISEVCIDGNIVYFTEGLAPKKKCV